MLFRFEPEWQEFWTLAAGKQVVALCVDALRLAVDRVGLGGDVLRHVPATTASAERSSAYLGGTRTPLRSLLLDLAAIDGTIGKMRFLVAHAAPDAAHMRATFGTRGSIGLAAAYTTRAVRGVRRLAGFSPSH